jgi:Kdo2-lipid IVA lauroyltransferase/acyltransferase
MSGARPVTAGHRVQDLAIRGVEGCLRLLPERLASALGAGLGRVAGVLLRSRRRVVEDNLRQAFPDRDADWIRRVASASWAHLGREGVALLRMGTLGPRAVWERTEVEGIEHVREPLSRGRGVIVLTGHLGNWEIGGAALAVREVPTDVVAKRQNNPLFDARMNGTRERLGMRVIDRDGGTRDILRALRAGRVVALVADQNVLHQGVFVEFFGRRASTARGPALLALRTGAAVVFATAIRQPGPRARYHVRCRPLDPPDPAREPEQAARVFLRRYLAALEADIAGAPEQYLWAHKRWKTRPDPLAGEGADQEPAAPGAVPDPGRGSAGGPATSPPAAGPGPAGTRTES